MTVVQILQIIVYCVLLCCYLFTAILAAKRKTIKTEKPDSNEEENKGISFSQIVLEMVAQIEGIYTPILKDNAKGGALKFDTVFTRLKDIAKSMNFNIPDETLTSIIEDAVSLLNYNKNQKVQSTEQKIINCEVNLNENNSNC